MIEHKSKTFDYRNLQFSCSFCRRYWPADEQDPGCISGYDRVIKLLNEEVKPNNERQAKQGGSR